MRRVVTTLTSVANGATGAQTNLTTPDDNTTRVLRNVYLSPQTAGVVLEVRRAGFLVQQIDALRFSNGNLPVIVDEQWPATIQFTVDVVNTSGSPYVGTVSLGYEPVPYPQKG